MILNLKAKIRGYFSFFTRKPMGSILDLYENPTRNFNIYSLTPLIRHSGFCA